MKIAIFTETYLPYINGVVTHIKILKEGLEALGHEVLIVTTDVHVTEHKIENGVLRCPALELKKIYNYGVSSPFSGTRKKLVEEFRPDIIHIQNEFSMGIAGIRASRAMNIPLVYTLHTMYDDYIYYIAPGPLTDIVKRISHQYIRFLSRRADIITGPSKKCEDYIHGAGVNRKIYIIPNSVELESYAEDATTQQERDAVRERYGIPKGAFVACFVGRIGKEKGIDRLMEMLSKNTAAEDNIYLLVIGGGPFLDEFRGYAERLGLGGRPVFTGAIPHEQLPPYYAACNCYATASTSEMYSISMLEGMASGLPVLQILDPDNRDQIQVGVNGWIYETGEEMAGYLRMLRDLPPGEKNALKASVRASVADKSSVRIAKFMLELYQKAIDKH